MRMFSPEWARETVFEWVRQIVAASPGVTIAEQQRIAARKCGIPVSRFRDLWYGEARRIDAHEAWAVQYQRNQLAEARERYDRERQEFVATAPRALARLVPPALPSHQELRRRKR